jgi:Family of unknown function (DUF5906)
MSDDDIDMSKVKPIFGNQKPSAAPPEQPKAKEDNEFASYDAIYTRTMISGHFRIIDESVKGKVELLQPKEFNFKLKEDRILLISKSPNGDPLPKIKQKSEEWIARKASPKCYDGVIFDPAKPYGRNDTIFNLWRGFKTKPVRGNCYRTLMHIKHMICRDNKSDYRWFLAWCAQMIQQPWLKPGTAVVLIGMKGIGKSIIPTILGELMDGTEFNDRPLYIVASNANHVFGDFNSILESAILINFEEAFWAGSHKHEGILKEMITGKQVVINPKGMPARQVNNYSRLIIIGNNDWVIPASFDERRFTVFDVDNKHRNDEQYFNRIINELNNGGREAFMYFLMNYDINKYNLRNCKYTKALIRQKVETLDGVKAWGYDILKEGLLPYFKIEDDMFYVIKEILFKQIKSQNRRAKDLTNDKIGYQFCSLFPKVINGQVQFSTNGRVISIIDNNSTIRNENKFNLESKGKTVGVYKIPKLSMCRKAFETIVGDRIEWENSDSEWELSISMMTDTSF